MHFEDNCIQIIVSDRKEIEIRRTGKNCWLHTAEKNLKKREKQEKLQNLINILILFIFRNSELKPINERVKKRQVNNCVYLSTGLKSGFTTNNRHCQIFC